MRQDDETGQTQPVEVTPAADATAAPEPGVIDTETATTSFEKMLGGEFSVDGFLAIWNAVGWPIVKALILIFVVLLVARWMRVLVVKAASKARVEVTLARFFGNLARWAILVLGILTILQSIGVEIVAFAAVLASVGFAIGLAMSGMVGNVASGIMLLVFRPYKVGDFVNAGGVSGTVYEIELFTTTMDTPDNRRVIVPNNEIFGKVIENVTYHPKRRVEVLVGTAYGADIDQTREVLMAAATAVDGRTMEDNPVVFLDELGGSSVNWKVRVWATKADFWTVRQRLTRDIKVALDSSGISIPFPQMDIRVEQVGGGRGPW